MVTQYSLHFIVGTAIDGDVKCAEAPREGGAELRAGQEGTAVNFGCENSVMIGGER